jgi:LPXTG-motif cell wall-anchored protein
MNKRILGGLAVAAMLAGGLALSSGGSASAVVQEEGPQVCYDQTPFQEWKFKKTVTTPAVEEVSHIEYRWDIETRTEILEYKYVKETRERSRDYIEVNGWQRYSFTGNWESNETPPPGPSINPGSWQANTASDPHGIGQEGAYYRSNGNSGNGDWFYLERTTETTLGEWGPWSEWTVWNNGSTTRWEPQGFTEEGDHDGNGNNGTFDRDYRYVPTGQTRSYSPKQYTAWTPAGSTEWSKDNTAPADTTTTKYVNKQSEKVVTVEAQPESSVTLYYNGGAVSETDANIYGTNNDLDRSWVKFGERTNPGEPFEVPCPIPPSSLGLTYNQDCAPDPTNTWRVRPTGVNQEVKWELFQDGDSIGSGAMNPGDGETVVEVPRKQPSTAILKFDSDGNGSLDKQTVKASGPDLTFSTNPEKCVAPPPEVDKTDWVGEPKCGESSYVQTRTVTTTPFVWDGKAWVPGEPVVTVKERTVEVEEVEPCPTTPPFVPPFVPPTEPPVTPEPPVTTAPTTTTTTEVAAQLPPTQVPTSTAPAAAPAPAPTVPAAALPATGSNSSGLTALIALLVTSLGGAAMMLSRRGRNVTS